MRSEAAEQEREQVEQNSMLLSSWLTRKLPPRDYLLRDIMHYIALDYLRRNRRRQNAVRDGRGGRNCFGSRVAELGGAAARRRVMYLDGELPAETFKERMDIVARQFGPDIDLYGYNRDILGDDEMPPLNTGRVKWLAKKPRAFQPEIIMFDRSCAFSREHGRRRKLGTYHADGAAVRAARSHNLAAPYGARHVERLRHQIANGKWTPSSA